MDAGDLVDRIIWSHEEGNDSEIVLTPNVVLRPQLNYGGKAAKDAYRGWRRDKNTNRRYCGLLDFQIIMKNAKTTHKKDMIAKTAQFLPIDITRSIYSGADPLAFRELDSNQKDVACCIQAGFAEQELNWGHEEYQSWTHFGNPYSKDELLVRSVPRDYQMLFIERCVYELATGMEWTEVEKYVLSPYYGYSRAASNEVILPPIRNGRLMKDFRSFHPLQICTCVIVRWVALYEDRIRALCEQMAPNPECVH